MCPLNYSISSNTFKSNLSKGFSLLQQVDNTTQLLFKQQEFVDVTIVADGHFVKAHQNIMALASPYLKAILQSVSCQHPIIFLSNIGHNILNYILEYMYTGEVEVPGKLYPYFINAAKQMHITGLDHLNTDNTQLGNSRENEKKEEIDIEQLNSSLNNEELRVELERDPRVSMTLIVDSTKKDETEKIYNMHTANIIKYDLSNSPGSNNAVIQCSDDVEELLLAQTNNANSLLIEIPNNERRNVNFPDKEDCSHNDYHSLDSNSNEEDEIQLQDTTQENLARPLYTTSTRGSLMMILNRFIYNMHHCSDKGRKRRWRCVGYRRKHCLAFVDTLDETITARINSHNHGFHDKKIISSGTKRKIFTSIKQASK